MGLLQELIHRVPTPKIPKGKATRVLSYGKYVTLGLLAVALPIYFGAQQLPLPAFCKYICPAGTLEGAVALLTHPENDSLFSMLHGLFTQKMVILILLAALCVFCYRAFCRFLCPLGAIYGFLPGQSAGHPGGGGQVHPLRFVPEPLPGGHPPGGRP